MATSYTENLSSAFNFEDTIIKRPSSNFDLTFAAFLFDCLLNTRKSEEKKNAPPGGEGIISPHFEPSLPKEPINSQSKQFQSSKILKNNLQIDSCDCPASHKVIVNCRSAIL
ncbi:MAG: hypothetical protein WAN35_17290 [Terracidiphilus sp.]